MNERTLWIFHMFAGLIMIICLGVHLFLNGLDYFLNRLGILPYTDPVGWEAMVIKGKNVLYTLNLVILVPAVVFHGLKGLRNIIIELISSETARKFVSIVLVILGVVMVIFGWWVVIRAYGNFVSFGL